MSGAVLAEFAGTPEEAREFARLHGLKYAKNKGREPNGLPYVSSPWKNSGDCVVVLNKFEALGWDRTSVQVTTTSNRKGRAR